VKREKVAFALLAALGLAVYLWPAFRAPVVLWSDSVTDLDWARQGIGLFREAPRGDHPAKPGYLLFLRVASAIPIPGAGPRAVVVVQSLLLWLSIGATSFLFGRRRGAAGGAALYVLLILFLRARDSASAVMTEALSAALFLPIAAFVLWPPRKASGMLGMGLAIATLFWIRPNLGAIAFLLACVALAAGRRRRGVLLLLAAFAAVSVPVWFATRPREKADPLGGLSYPLLEATADYYWRPSIEPWPRADSPAGHMRAELSRAVANWKATLASRGPDARRQILWRTLHGLFGTEFYDARWSPAYARATALSRIAAPFLILAAAALLLCLPFRGPEAGANFAGPLLLLALLAQDLVLGPSPRYVLPALPALLLFGAATLAPWKGAPRARRLASNVLFAALVGVAAIARSALDWQWGMIESSGVRLVQPIARGALPRTAPATLHVRIAAPVVPASPQLEIFGPGSRRLYTSREDTARERPYVTIPLPDWLLESNRAGPVEISLLSGEGYGVHSYLLFPVIPPPWSEPARREGSSALSPATGIVSGALDWWAHPGAP
jgi:hypothetical protein